ncbi:MAG TPA: hypothetical protein VEB21_18490 [Terriglobales bacterium]|nr:hypothetical protein [Terriglobales bacterium]
MGSVSEANLTEFFRDLLREAMRSQAVDSSEDTEFYLVKLLESFIKPDHDWLDRPLALEFLESFHSPDRLRYGKLKRVGDTTLFLSGIFMESLHRKVVGPDYYISLGRSAYEQLSGLSAELGAHVGDSFAELADRFTDYVRVLAELSLEQMFQGDATALRVYTRWLYTRGENDRRWLTRHGIIPFVPDHPRRH